jgi:hypothetical protein
MHFRYRLIPDFRSLTIASFGVLCIVASSQATEPITVERIERQTPDGVVRGIAATIDLRSVRIVVTRPIESAPDGVEARAIPTDAWATAQDVTLAINANYFAHLEDEWIDIVGLSVCRGDVVSPTRFHDGKPDPAIFFLENGSARAAEAGADLSGVADAVAGVGASLQHPDLGGLLVTDGRNTGATARVQPMVRHPRTAIGVSADGWTLVAIVIDGRQEGWSVGATLPEVADLLIERGVDDAVNLDGGGSSSFVYRRGMEGQAITNRPSDGRFRPVGNHLGFRIERDAGASGAGAVRPGFSGAPAVGGALASNCEESEHG